MRSDKRVADGLTSWTTRYNTLLTCVAALIGPFLYFTFINRYAVNSFYGDDWSIATLVHQALHGRLSLSQLWRQYNESRLFMGNTIDVLFGYVDRLNLRSIVFFDAAVFTASYALLLGLLRRYLGERLTPIPVLAVGVVWFSWADVQNSLWAFQLSWYLTVLFLLLMLFALLVPIRHRRLWFSVAVIAAIAGSLSTIQGFTIWPLGAVAILWPDGSVGNDRVRTLPPRVVREIVTWAAAAIGTIALYLPGYDVHENGCLSGCTPSVALRHPITVIKFFFALIGNVVPGGVLFFPSTQQLWRFEALGVVLFVAAIAIAVQSWRHRAFERVPVPLLLIGFGLIFDVTIALGRGGTGPAGAVSANRYVMPNLVLLTGIVIYAWKHRPSLGSLTQISIPRLAAAVVAVFLVVQVKEAIDFGRVNGGVIHSAWTSSARFFVNSDRVSPPEPRVPPKPSALLPGRSRTLLRHETEFGKGGPTWGVPIVVLQVLPSARAASLVRTLHDSCGGQAALNPGGTQVPTEVVHPPNAPDLDIWKTLRSAQSTWWGSLPKYLLATHAV